ncbi:MAG: type II secretion system GspH family protein [Phycisphaerae bacterium]|nr:type II secretion system GspH family protein [Phycisphaerae bacterium]MDW8261381.1 type II secretion system protein [Phycisphaerales bacterium]
MSCWPQSLGFCRRKCTGFTLVELLVSIGIVAVLLAVLLPILGKARREANRTFCLNNLRNMQLAQLQYAHDHNGYLVQAGLSHDGVDMEGRSPWIETLQRYYSGSANVQETRSHPAITVRCPSDVSPHWPGEVPVPQSNPPIYRRTSYGINDFLDIYECPWGPGQANPPPPGGWYPKITKIKRPSVTIQFLEMAYTGPYAGSDHPHTYGWTGSNPPVSAARQLEIHAHGGPRAAWDSIANYGFLDGHAESLRFREVFRDLTTFNRFDPSLAR